ncbi:hypothetical protein [Capnocytophaga catalasegens]|uniref:Uncharacterized protein n=1 Tax=Capnocytophaga catalasegens TaxID=1004260 RepID=A0AAV5AX58_9FLAO|nr:hypothetical protein [Capnocytophaga catalasegens]GIZ14136.1 hypothetical protein RCZ03_01370 [Capnocytophaga catalasegens]GJM49930.1 hypothetical protein RCZ15_09050 [Capnocytophaga catalasegens]GJM51701.1 hypothetical protein RCZ16_00190 [Capnocytophaga catalasegens]
MSEYDNISSADVITMFRNRYVIADFKYSSTDNYNTIAEELIKGFKQSDCIVLKMDKGNSGTFRKIIEQIERKKVKPKDFILINKYNKVLEISRKEIQEGKYKALVKGFL